MILRFGKPVKSSPSKINSALSLYFQAFEKAFAILSAELLTWHVQCLSSGMAIFETNKTSQKFDDSHFFQRLTLIDICCGPPIQS
jgi:hypothetical protein